MTFSLCTREIHEDPDGEEHSRFGVAVTTRLPAVGTLCPFANEHGAVATQSRVNVDLGRMGIEYLADGLAVDDALEALLNADEGRAERQLHGVDAETTFVFSGEDCRDWYGHLEREGLTVAGNLLVGESVIETTADAFEAADPADPLAARLIDALAAGQAAGGDKREELTVQSAALKVSSTEERDEPPLYNDLRVDASETPVADLRDTFELAFQADRQLRDRAENAD